MNFSTKSMDDLQKVKCLAFSFLVFLIYFESYIFNVSYSDYFIYLYDKEDFFWSLILVACQSFSLYLFFRLILLTFSVSLFYKIIFFILFVLSTFIEYGYQKALGRFTESFDIETAVATNTEQKIASLFFYFNYTAVIPCAICLSLLLFTRKIGKQPGQRNILTTTILLISFFCFLSFSGSFFIERKFPTVSLNNFFETNSDFLILGPLANGKWVSSITGKELSRRQISKPLLNENFHPENNIIIVLDESVMGDHLSLNGYDRKTTPFLDKLANQGILHNWGIAAAASTGSRFTYNAVITGLTPEDLPDKTEFKINSFPTIFQYAKAMNYKTFFFDGQMKNYWGGIPDDKNYIDSWMGVEKFDDNGFSPIWEIDNRIAREVKQIINSSKGNFIFIFKHGSHIPYQSNFPPDQVAWQPTYTTENKFEIPTAENLPKVINSYDNSIRYNIDSFFQNLIDDYAGIPNQTIIIYTGDHGQTLFVNGKASHGGTSKAEASVPLFIIGELPGEIDTKYKASHQNLYPTILDLINYPEELREKNKAVSLLKAKAKDSTPRFFNPDLSAKVPFD